VTAPPGFISVDRLRQRLRRVLSAVETERVIRDLEQGEDGIAEAARRAAAGVRPDALAAARAKRDRKRRRR